MYVITGATGNIGKIIVNELLSKGKRVRVIGRNYTKLNEFVEKGAEAMAGDVMDSNFVNRAFAEATAVFCMIPPNVRSNDFRSEQRKIATNYAQAVRINSVKFALLLSSIGAHLRNGAGVVDGLGELEEEFARLNDVNVLNLRAAIFMENLYGQLGMIRDMGIIGSAVKADIKLPMVATKDIGAVAAKHLLDLDFYGNTVEYVLGPKDISYNEVAVILGKAIGKADLKYVHFSYDDAKNGMVRSGAISENVAGLYTGLAEGINNGSIINAHNRTKENTTPTTLEEFSYGLARAYNHPEAVMH
jgi:uncharacterized protein YbjT (DUF2867 family)